MKLKNSGHLDYWFSKATEASQPLVFFLHGSGERGSNPKDVLQWGLPKSVRSVDECPFHLVAPQCPADSMWSDIVAECERLLMDTRTKLQADIPLIGAGFSMGGEGILEIAASKPGLFRSVLAVAPRNSTALKAIGYDQLAQTKTVIIHGVDDPIVPVVESKTIAAAIQLRHGDVRLELLPDKDHFIADEVFSIANFQSLLHEHLLGQL